MKIILTESAIEKIKRLILEKCRSSTSEQKVIRGKIRKLGFRYEDFYGKKKEKGGYTIEHLKYLIENGLIEVV